MTDEGPWSARDFCFWLSGFIEIPFTTKTSLSKEAVDLVAKRLMQVPGITVEPIEKPKKWPYTPTDRPRGRPPGSKNKPKKDKK